MRYTFARCNAFFKILYAHGVFIPAGEDKDLASEAAFDTCAAWLVGLV